MRLAVPWLLRTVAVLIAVAAVVDPMFTTARRSDAVIAVIPADATADNLAAALRQRISTRFEAVPGPWPGAAATVVAGRSVPRDADGRGPVFAVLPAPPTLELAPLRYAPRVPPDALAGVGVTARVAQAGKVELRLLRQGVVVDAVDTVMAAPGRLHTMLTFVPSEEGHARLRVEARTGGGAVVARDMMLEVVPWRWRVLFHDGRPSWLSTFVRRTVEQDPRFEVSARVVTSRGVATDFGSAVPALSDARSLDAFDAVVVGTPETLDAAQVATLERFMRQRGGAVLLLPDRTADGPWRRLAGVTSWQGSQGAAVTLLRDYRGTTPLRTGARSWPAALPAGATTLLADDDGRPVIWRTAVGAGGLVVSGALDSWQFRDPETSAFETFWPELLAGLASAAPPLLQVDGPGTVAPGEWATLQVTLRNQALGRVGQGSPSPAETRAPATASMQDGTPLELWPAAEPGILRAEFRAPARPGEYHVVVENDDGALRVPVHVHPSPAAPRDDGDILAALARRSGGGVLDEASAAELPLLLQQVLRTERTPQPWRPMQSPWWILPFVAALGGEWWWRRRRALP